MPFMSGVTLYNEIIVFLAGKWGHSFHRTKGDSCHIWCPLELAGDKILALLPGFLAAHMVSGESAE